MADRTGHCSACHRTFSSLAAFDLHVSTDPVTGRSVHRDPAQVLRTAGGAAFSPSVDAAGALVWRRADPRDHPHSRHAQGLLPGARAPLDNTVKTTNNLMATHLAEEASL